MAQVTYRRQKLESVTIKISYQLSKRWC